jgi:hypothetical protein
MCRNILIYAHHIGARPACFIFFPHPHGTLRAPYFGDNCVRGPVPQRHSPTPITTMTNQFKMLQCQTGYHCTQSEATYGWADALSYVLSSDFRLDLRSSVRDCCSDSKTNAEQCTAFRPSDLLELSPADCSCRAPLKNKTRLSLPHSSAALLIATGAYQLALNFKHTLPLSGLSTVRHKADIQFKL